MTQGLRRVRARLLLTQIMSLTMVLPGVLGLGASVAHAQVPAASPPPSAATLGQAKKFFEAGMKLYKQSLFQEALAQFLESNRLAPREGTQRNIGQTYRDLKDNAAAFEAYETLLAEYSNKMKPQLKSDAQQALQELAVLTGTIAIGVQEPGARVTVDGKDSGTTPLAKPLRVNLGTHAVSITKEGFEALTQPVDLQPGRNAARVDGPLAREILTGHLNVTALPADAAATAHVLVDDKDVGAPPWQGDLDPGQHTVQVKNDAMSSETRPIDVARKGSYDIALTLKALAGTLSVNANLPDAVISIDGVVVGRGAFEQTLALGKHELKVAKAGFVPYRKQLIVSEGVKLVEYVPLQPETPGAPGGGGPVEWDGVYTRLTMLGLFEPGKPSNDVAQGIGYTKDTGITGSGAYGGALDLTVGYSFGIVSVEGGVLFGYDHSKDVVQVNSAQGAYTEHPPVNPGAGVTYPPGYTETYDFHRVGGDFTLGARIMPKTQKIRPTLGAAFGLALKSALYNRGVDAQLGLATTGSTVTSSFTTYLAPALKIDGGIELGSTPGTRFYLGMLVLAEFAKGVSAAGVSPASPPSNFPPPQIELVHGTDVFIGPILGVWWGS